MRALALVMVALCAPGVTGASVRPLAVDRPAAIIVAYDATANRYTLRSEGEQTVVYTVDLDDADLVQGMLRVEASVAGRAPIAVVNQAGTRYRSASDVVSEPDAIAPAAGAQLLDHRLEGDTLVLRFREQPGAHLLEKTYRLHLEGGSLVVELRSDSTWGLDGYAGASLGWAQGTSGTRVVSLPYLPEPLALFPDGSVLTAYIDPTVSSSTGTTRAVGPGSNGRLFAHGRSLSEPDTAGVSAPLSETAYVTLSDDLAGVLPRVDGPPSPHRSALSPRLVLDLTTLRHTRATPEGVAVVWTTPKAGLAHLTLRTGRRTGRAWSR